jgi:hypothetical protein
MTDDDQTILTKIQRCWRTMRDSAHGSDAFRAAHMEMTFVLNKLADALDVQAPPASEAYRLTPEELDEVSYNPFRVHSSKSFREKRLLRCENGFIWIGREGVGHVQSPIVSTMRKRASPFIMRS